MRKILGISAVLGALMIGCSPLLAQLHPPMRGTITMKGSHPKTYSSHDIVSCNNRYYFCIASDNGAKYATWYVPSFIFTRYEIGDHVNILGRIN